ncbi:hypothetical protein [Catenuloplanes atrovinosus]|uniref:Lipoprotein n=1 Tax=Catenuloplanes atrovinosus TaxID=137266 RepID=A0AAE4C9L2_9ACTN|nr:hypothetical protein [Catenuloplanes atrovinosus]MDR7275937.1 hypothetical protein [Catenuloplanes atrovinosus]
MRKSIAAIAVSFTLAGCAGAAAENAGSAASPSPSSDAKAVVVAAFTPLNSGTSRYSVTYEELAATVRVQRDHAADTTLSTLSITVTDDDRALVIESYRVGGNLFTRFDASQLPPGSVPEEQRVGTWVRFDPKRTAAITEGIDALAVTPDRVAAAVTGAQRQTVSRITGTVDLTAIVPDRYDSPAARNATFRAELNGDGSIGYFTVDVTEGGKTTTPLEFRGLGQATRGFPPVPGDGQYRDASPGLYTLALPID